MSHGVRPLLTPTPSLLSRPGVRERFVFHPHRYCSNKFWLIFANSFRILWPYEFRDCYTRSTHTGRYTISPTFQSRISDIRAFTMCEDLFQVWPELRADIPAFESIGRSLTPSVPVPAQSQAASQRSSSTVAPRRPGQRKKQNVATRRGPSSGSAYAASGREKSFATTVSEVELLGEEAARTGAGSVLEAFEMTPVFEGGGYHLSSWAAWSSSVPGHGDVS